MGGERSGRSLGWYLRAQLTGLDPGPLWFVLAFLSFSTGYAVWRTVRPPAAPLSRRTMTTVDNGTLAAWFKLK